MNERQILVQRLTNAYDYNHMPKKSLLPVQAATQGDDVQHERVANVAPRIRCVKAGAFLFRQGDTSIGLFRLASGLLRLVRVTPQGAEVPMHTVRPGELFAEASIFSPAYHCDALALKDSEVLVYSKTELVRELKTNPEDLWTFAAEVARRVQGLRTALELRQIRSAPERVLQALRLRCDSHGIWKTDGTLKQLAEEIGLTHEALYRAMARLERSGHIARAKNVIRLEPREHVRNAKT